MASDDAPASSAPSAAPTNAPAAAAPVPVEERTRHKRPRAAVDPGTPKRGAVDILVMPLSLFGEEQRMGEGDELRGVSGSTPLAKKGRVEGDDDGASDTDRPATPPPTAGSSSSRPSTPAKTSAAPAVPPATEGKDTKQLRERVQAMKPPGQTGEGDELAPPTKEDVEIAEVADEVSESAADLGDKQDAKEEKDVEIAEVAAEVGKSAESADRREEQAAEGSTTETSEAKEAAADAAEVAEAAAPVQAKDAEAAETAAETADAAKAAPEPTPAPTPKPAAAQPTFANYSSTASPFSAFASSASPLASVSTPTKPAAEEQKPKPRAAFSASPFLSSSIPPATPAASASKPSGAATDKPSTPFTKAAATTNLAAASPFAAFASTSGFASASKTSGTSAFGAFSAAPSAFSSVPATPARKGDSEDAAATPSGRKIGEPEEVDESRPVFTEQETVTGEEEEELLHSVRAKLFAMSEGQWAERGTGVLKLNETREKHGARLVMRADATHRLLLNAPLFREFSISVFNEKYVRFSVIEGDKPTSYMLRTGNPAGAENLVKAVQDKVSTL
ncbi:hypothetical protein Rhopal_004598-T1 [Rhodotorula paludigena]|uniref:RanBD1 domain-containing protein n=1 Tax=Rhodotorula paludigena TaxID=86838 RepID=A0AAV5GPY4_9BASI|nr:hypothetical protein Rhopal_004598-T1 [Rhodotorula paludigena]